jgi:uncharacterized protein (DUF433 family)
MDKEHVQARDGNLYVGPSRVTLDSIVIAWQAGQRPEDIQQDFATLSLADIYGAIAYYLDHQPELDQWLRAGQELYETRRAAAHAAKPDLYARLRGRLDEARADRGTGASDDDQGAAIPPSAAEPPMS